MPVVRLTESVINQIAAGEVVERPASMVKELMENAIDAGAGRIDVSVTAGGKNLVRVSDDGHGMSAQDLELAVDRHCTSKITQGLLNIRTLGFRGEALPSIGSVAHMTVTTRQKNSSDCWRIVVDNGKKQPLQPASLLKGTVFEVTNLFANIPARMKFLKSNQAETNAITDVFRRIALAFPNIRFSLSGPDRSSLEFLSTDLIGRVSQILGTEFEKNALRVDAGREGFRLEGFAALPTFNRGNAQHQYFFVNGRPVKDKSMFGAVRSAYSDFLARDRHAVAILFLTCDPSQVDVNVHPAKTEVRFRDGGLVRGLIAGALKQTISNAGHRTSSEGGRNMMAAFGPEGRHTRKRVWKPEISPYYPLNETKCRDTDKLENNAGLEELEHTGNFAFSPSGQTYDPLPDKNASDESLRDSYPLGVARAQVHENYIVSQTSDGLIIIDQHAAHERIVYEKLKAEIAEGVASQILLIPEVVELPEEAISQLLDHAEMLARFGLVIEKFGPSAIVTRETPAILEEVNVHALVNDLVDEITEWGSGMELVGKLEKIASSIACHGSIRSGRILKADEMNALLRQMENTPNSGQCNHGRPTYIELKLKDIERLFGR